MEEAERRQYYGIIARGEMRCRRKGESLRAFAVILAILLCQAAALAVLANNVATSDIIELPFQGLEFLLLTEGAFMIGWGVVRMICDGRPYTYEADEKEFRITSVGKKPKREVLYYTDVAAVEYKPLHHLNRRLRGYRVTITTKYRKIVYDYVFGRKKLFTEPKDTPFRIIEEQAGLVGEAGGKR